MKMQSIFIFFFFLRNKPKAEVYQRLTIHLLNALGITQVHSVLVQNKQQAKL